MSTILDAKVVEGGIVNYKSGSMPSRAELLVNLKTTGFILISNVDHATPAALLRFGTTLGSTDVHIDEELLGPMIMDLKYDSAKIKEHQKPAYFTSDYFPVHTDVSYVHNPPRFMLLHCISPDPEGGGSCLLANCAAASGLLNETEQDILTRKIFRFAYPPNCPIGDSALYAVRDTDLWRFKYSGMKFTNEASVAVESFYQALQEKTIQIFLERGDLLIVDNHRIAHGRTSFRTKRPEHSGRHIRRLYATI